MLLFHIRVLQFHVHRFLFWVDGRVAESQVEHVQAAAVYDAGGQGGRLLS